MQQNTYIKVSLVLSDLWAQRILHRYLEDFYLEGYEVETQTFETGGEFLDSDWVSSDEPHLVFVDEQLHGSSGLEIVHRLVSNRKPNPFTIFQLAFRRSEDEIVYGYEQGIDFFLFKPVNLKLLDARMRRTLKRLI
ncbi:response regulator transcription factor [Halalkalibacillus halophilus]|uniref:response regulator transcription factor n=1 Tax=Halalkalibacillus halophilus TaxID=392827 RepID=UPI00041C8D19|nr:response regulator [Halalkalibacillus halophilus]